MKSDVRTKKSNPYHWLYTTEQVDKRLEEGYEVDTLTIPVGDYDLDEFARAVTKEAERHGAGDSFYIHSWVDRCDDEHRLYIQYRQPLTDEQRAQLKERREEILQEKIKREDEALSYARFVLLERGVKVWYVVEDQTLSGAPSDPHGQQAPPQT